MKNMFYINKGNEYVERIRNSVFNYQEMIKDMSGEMDKLEMCNILYKEKLNKLEEYINCRIEEFENAGKSRIEIKAYQYYKLLCDIEKILNSSL